MNVYIIIIIIIIYSLEENSSQLYELKISNRIYLQYCD